MSRYLPDVNTLLALMDPAHVHHEDAHLWYANLVNPNLILCSHVENGVIRVASQPKYPNSLGTAAHVRASLQQLRSKLNPDSCSRDVSLLDDGIVIRPDLLAPSRVSDFYLLALAVAHQGRFATFDRGIHAEAIAGGTECLEVIPIRRGEGL